MFLNIIEQSKNEFSTKFDDIYMYDKENKLFHNPFSVDINDVVNNLLIILIFCIHFFFLKDTFIDKKNTNVIF